MRSLSVAVLLLLIYTIALAQHRREYVFTNYSTSNGGLATNLVNQIAQDEKGYMWFATYNGLQRFDGNKFQTFRNTPDNNKTIPNNHIQTLFFDKKHRLWLAGNNNTIGFFNTTQFFFQETPVQNASNTKSYIPKNFLETPDGQLLVYEEKGAIYRYDNKAARFILENGFAKLPFNWKQNRITWDGFLHKYWIACDSGLVLYNPANKLVSYRGHNEEQDPIIKSFEKATGIINVFVSTDNTVSFYTKQYALYHHNRKSNTATIEDPGKKLGLKFYEIQGLFHQRNGRAWVHGVKLFAQWLPEKGMFLPVSSFYNAEYKIKSNFVNSVFEDRENNLWVATDNGLFLFNPDTQLFDAYRLARPQENNSTEDDVLTMSILQTKDEKLYVGSWKAGLFLFDKHFNALSLPQPLQTLKKDYTIWNIYEHIPMGKLWLAVENQQNRRLIVYDPQKGTTQWVNNPLFTSNVIRIIADQDNNLWFGTQEGHIIKWNYLLAKGDINTGYELIAKEPGTIRKLYNDWQGYIWVVTNKGGLLKIDSKKNRVERNFTEQTAKGFQLLGNNIFDILQYNDSILIAAADANLNLINVKTQKVTHLSTADGLPANTIVSIQKDKQGIIWLGLLGGICRVNLEKKTFTTYNRKDGIPYDNFLTGKALLLQNGRLLFTTSEGLLVIDPTKAVQSIRPTQPLITSFYLANKTLPLDSLLKNDVKLNYDNSSIAIGFSNLSFSKQRTLHYYYKMAGLDKDWIQADATNQAQYNYIQPGTYTFYVKTVNEDGVSSKDAAMLHIVVKPPFWKTGLFYAIVILLGFVVLFLVDKERIKRLRIVQQMRSQIAGDLHNDIHVTLNDINVLSAMAKIKADKDIDRSKDYIDTISIKSRDMMESMKDILWTLDPDNDSMEKMLLRIQEYTYGIKNSDKAEIELNSSSSIKNLLLDMRCRHEFLLFFKHALSFIVQKTHYPTIRIALTYEKGKLILHFDAQSAYLNDENLNTHLAEEELYKRAEALNADLRIANEKHKIEIWLQLNA